MNAAIKQAYDPHLLYYAINITVELEYKVPMQKVYDILAIMDANKGDNSELQVSPQEVIELLNALGDSVESSVLTGEESDGESLQDKIKELLRLLGCLLTDQELNKLLKGELSLDDVLSPKAKTAWLMVFHKSKDGLYRPNKEIVEHILLCCKTLALENVELKIQKHMAERTYLKEREKSSVVLARQDERSFARLEKERNDPRVLEEKRNKLRLYIAHMQGYDRDRDRDGGRGIDMVTGYVIDFGDIYIADKASSHIIEDKEHDGIDIGDIH